MRVTKLTIHNVGKIGDTVIKLDKPLLLFYGEIRQGKTTILNAVRWVCGGDWPTDIISHGKDDAHIELEFDGGVISRSWYRAKEEKKETKSRPVVFIKNGKPVSSPVSEIKRFLNPFLIDQDHLRNKTELERKQFFAELFAVDTTELDKEWFNNDREASNLRIAIKSYGQLDLTPVEKVEISALEAELQKARSKYATEKASLESQLEAMAKKHQSDCASIDQENESARTHNASVERAENTKLDIQGAIESHQKKIAELEAQLVAIIVAEKRTIKDKPQYPDRTVIQKKILDLAPDTSALEKQIREAGATNVRAEQYAANKKRADEKSEKEAEVSKLEARQREIKKEKQAKLKEVSDSCGIKDLAFDDAGNFIYQGTQAGMLSTSQIMRLSSELSALYPEGFGIELLDRGESLGKSIFEFVERAKGEKKTILATIVGELPAKVPKDIGVFVVSNGVVEEENFDLIP